MTAHNNEIENSRTGGGANVMKKEYKRYGRLIYCYYPESYSTVRVDSKMNEIMTYHFKLSDWDEMGIYEECTKKEFKMAMYAAIKSLTK